MKIIAGKHKGRLIKTSDNKNYRPTTGRTREALFSILSSGRFLTDAGSILNNAIILDLFCGTGSFSFEALSRGAKRVIAIDIEQDHIYLVKENAIKFGEVENITVIRADAAMLPRAKQECDIVFMDPPYNQNLVAKALKSLKDKCWLKNGAIIITELDRKETLEEIVEFSIIDERIYGKTKIIILEYKQG